MFLYKEERNPLLSKKYESGFRLSQKRTILADAGSGVILTTWRYCIGQPFSRCMLAQVNTQISAEFDPW